MLPILLMSLIASSPAHKHIVVKATEDAAPQILQQTKSNNSITLTIKLPIKIHYTIDVKCGTHVNVPSVNVNGPGIVDVEIQFDDNAWLDAEDCNIWWLPLN